MSKTTINRLTKQLRIMTELAYMKWGNSDPDVVEQIDASNDMLRLQASQGSRRPPDDIEPNQLARWYGAKSLAHVAKVSGISRHTLRNWYNNPERRFAFEAICEKVASYEF